jgi:hypothetical protein
MTFCRLGQQSMIFALASSTEGAVVNAGVDSTPVSQSVKRRCLNVAALDHFDNGSQLFGEVPSRARRARYRMMAPVP